MTAEHTNIDFLDITILCPPWHKLSTARDFKISSFSGELTCKNIFHIVHHALLHFMYQQMACTQYFIHLTMTLLTI